MEDNIEIWELQKGGKEFQWVTLSRLNRSQREWASVFPNAHYNSWPIHYCDNVHYLLDSTLGKSPVFMTTVAWQAATKIKIITTVTHMQIVRHFLVIGTESSVCNHSRVVKWHHAFIDFNLFLQQKTGKRQELIYFISQSGRTMIASQSFTTDLQRWSSGSGGAGRGSGVQSPLTDVFYIFCHFILQKYWGVAELKCGRYHNPSPGELTGAGGRGLKSHLEPCHWYPSHPRAIYERLFSKAAIAVGLI